MVDHAVTSLRTGIGGGGGAAASYAPPPSKPPTLAEAINLLDAQNELLEETVGRLGKSAENLGRPVIEPPGNTGGEALKPIGLIGSLYSRLARYEVLSAALRRAAGNIESSLS